MHHVMCDALAADAVAAAAAAATAALSGGGGGGLIAVCTLDTLSICHTEICGW